MEPTTNGISAKIIGALVVGLLVGFAAGVFWQDRRSGGATEEISTQTLETKTKEQTASMVAGAGNATEAGVASAKGLTVEDQTAGDRVEIASLDAKEVLWVAVREQKDGKPGNILGAQKVFVGDAQKVSIELLRPTVAGGTYLVVVYRDVGTPAFNYREDEVVAGLEGTFSVK